MLTSPTHKERVYSSWPAPSLLAWRRYRMLTQRELAANASVDVSTIVRAESGAALQGGTLRKLAKTLRCKLDDLITESEDDDSGPTPGG
jgi:transcriptional regulator with XRE-family HTH domain